MTNSAKCSATNYFARELLLEPIIDKHCTLEVELNLLHALEFHSENLTKQTIV